MQDRITPKWYTAIFAQIGSAAVVFVAFYAWHFPSADDIVDLVAHLISLHVLLTLGLFELVGAFCGYLLLYAFCRFAECRRWHDKWYIMGSFDTEPRDHTIS